MAAGVHRVRVEPDRAARVGAGHRPARRPRPADDTADVAGEP